MLRFRVRSVVPHPAGDSLKLPCACRFRPVASMCSASRAVSIRGSRVRRGIPCHFPEPAGVRPAVPWFPASRCRVHPWFRFPRVSPCKVPAPAGSVRWRRCHRLPVPCPSVVPASGGRFPVTSLSLPVSVRRFRIARLPDAVSIRGPAFRCGYSLNFPAAAVSVGASQTSDSSLETVSLSRPSGPRSSRWPSVVLPAAGSGPSEQSCVIRSGCDALCRSTRGMPIGRQRIVGCENS